MLLLPPLLPVLAAAVQSAWIVLLRGTRIYQALLWPYEPFGNQMLYWLWMDVLARQMVLAIMLLWPIVRLPNLHRVIAALLLAGCLYYDFFVVTRWVLR